MKFDKYPKQKNLQIAREKPDNLRNIKGERGTCTIPRVILAITNKDNPLDIPSTTQTTTQPSCAETQVDVQTDLRGKRKRNEEAVPITRPLKGPMEIFLTTRQSVLVIDKSIDGN